MSLPRYAQRLDENHMEIVQALERCGFATYFLARPVDLLVWPRNGFGHFGLMEIKNPAKPKADRQLTPAQEAFFGVTEGLPREKVETTAEALAFARTLREKITLPREQRLASQAD